MYWGGIATLLMDNGLDHGLSFDELSRKLSLAHQFSVQHKIGFDAALRNDPKFSTWAPKLLQNFQKEWADHHVGWPFDITKKEQAQQSQTVVKIIQRGLDRGVDEEMRERDNLFVRYGNSAGGEGRSDRGF
jgi:hypothetical protein